MIKCKIANRRVEVLEASGSTKTIAVEVAALVAKSQICIPRFASRLPARSSPGYSA